MKTRFLLALGIILSICYSSCKNSTEENVEVAIDSTRVFIDRWEKKNKEQMLTPEDRINFTIQWNKLVQENKRMGIVKESLSKERINEVEMLYSGAKALKNVMIMQEIQNNLQSRGTNSAEGEEDSGQLIVDF